MGESAQFVVRELLCPTRKAALCEKILRRLPDWFGIEDAIVDYVHRVHNQLVYGLFPGSSSEEEAVGFIALELHFSSSAEIYVMGVLPECHRTGGGRLLVNAVENECISRGIQYLTVKTLSPSRECGNYEKTRKFYEASGFEPLEEFKTLWGEENPCLYMIKLLQRGGCPDA